MVQRFYNDRRAQVLAAKPNEAHLLLVKLEKYFDLTVITQNIDDLHERAGSKHVVHLHGLITYAQSDKNASLTYPIIGSEIKMGELCELGFQLRPHVVWFGEAVPMIEFASFLCKEADLFIVIGTSLAVYPAAGLVDFVKEDVNKFIIDPIIPSVDYYQNIIKVEKTASAGLDEIFLKLIEYA